MRKSSLLWALLVLVTLGCFDNPNEIDMDLIHRKVAVEVEDYRKLKLYDCRNTIIADAELKVDSLLSDSLNVRIDQGLYFPIRPLRPRHVGMIRLDDSTVKKPLIDRTKPSKIDYKTSKDSINL